jgi:hypothetical protein
LICQETCDTVFYRHQRQDYVDEIDAAKAAAASQAQAGKMIVVFLDALTAFGAGLVLVLLTLPFACCSTMQLIPLLQIILFGLFGVCIRT